MIEYMLKNYRIYRIDINTYLLHDTYVNRYNVIVFNTYNNKWYAASLINHYTSINVEVYKILQFADLYDVSKDFKKLLIIEQLIKEQLIE